MKKRLPLALEAFVWPAALLYRSVMNLRNFAYERSYLLSEGVSAQVLSVGNLTAGGTGKTPLVAFLVRGFQARGKKVGIVSRGYGGSERGPARVPSSAGSAERFGDEPTWLARTFPNVAVVIGRDRVRAAQMMMDEDDVDLIIADDAFQHRRLRRRMDIVVIDATEPRWHYRSLPLGRMREGFQALTRAHAVFITKCNLADGAQIAWVRQQVDAAFRRFEVPPFVFEMASHLPEFTKLAGVGGAGGGVGGDAGGAVVPAAALTNQRVVLASGIGRPETFAQLVREVGAVVIEHIEFVDHHAYAAADFERIASRARETKADAIVITEKDAVKFVGPGASFPVPVYVSRLETRLTPSGRDSKIEDFYEAFDRAVL